MTCTAAGMYGAKIQKRRDMLWIGSSTQQCLTWVSAELFNYTRKETKKPNGKALINIANFQQL